MFPILKLSDKIYIRQLYYVYLPAMRVFFIGNCTYLCRYT